MTSRPSTSKPRGVCKYYNVGPRGCLAGNSCKFLHGEEKLTPFDKAKICRFYGAGFCKRGASCWFKHVLPDARSLPVEEHPPPPTEDVCGICLEQPVTFGLLSHCTHAFCLECVKQWRDQKNNQDDPDGEAHRANKRCPYCRALSTHVIPSSHYYPEGHPGKAAIMKRYKESTSRIPCKYFKASPQHDRYCPFGIDCLYKHENADGTLYVFNRGVDFYMPVSLKIPRTLSYHTDLKPNSSYQLADAVPVLRILTMV
ncbi:hypothetical protein PENSPDRAFT_585751 [Peniophora sp. CONT]|nr:hypothetical protein PENSPDRAFT_585751 [Peniophora sp. CONT]